MKDKRLYTTIQIKEILLKNEFTPSQSIDVIFMVLKIIFSICEITQKQSDDLFKIFLIEYKKTEDERLEISKFIINELDEFERKNKKDEG